MEIIKLRDEYIKLGQALKAAGLVESGVDAKFAIEDGLPGMESGMDSSFVSFNVVDCVIERFSEMYAAVVQPK